MRRIEVELIGEDVNATVVRVPQRKYPGLLLQGDSLAILLEAAQRASEALDRSALAEAQDEVAEVVQLLKSYVASYERALNSEGMDLPYVRKRR